MDRGATGRYIDGWVGGGLMRTVVITGSTRGIGLGLAHAFLGLDCNVVLAGRHEHGVQDALHALASLHDPERVSGKICDVRSLNQVEVLWQAAIERHGSVDIWINNAGLSNSRAPLWEIPPGELRAVLDANALGTLHGVRVAVPGMLAQGSGALYNLEGLGSDGRVIAGLGLYGSTKRFVHYITDALTLELKGTPVIVGAIQPGMVMTDLIVSQYREHPEQWQRDRFVFEALADSVDNVAPWVARRVLANKRSGTRIVRMGKGSAMARFATAWRRKGRWDTLVQGAV